tara:strand:+ start:12328 stop:12534 length:207 start_codon:yes stop_codon:yes gene_type:complete
MPIYEYKCDSCGNEFEDLQSVDAPRTRRCLVKLGPRKVCKGTSRRTVSGGQGFDFKGPGFHVNDYPKG